jgi:hypothetical protein
MRRIVKSRERLPIQRDNFPNPANTAVAADAVWAPVAVDFRRRQNRRRRREKKMLN